MIAHNLDISKVMILSYKAVIKSFKVSMSDHFNLYRFKFRNITGYRGGIDFDFFDNSFFIARYTSWWRIIKQALSMQSQKQL